MVGYSRSLCLLLFISISFCLSPFLLYGKQDLQSSEQSESDDEIAQINELLEELAELFKNDQADINEVLESLGAISCADSVEKQPYIGEMLQNRAMGLNVFKLLGIYGDLTNEQLEAWIRQELSRNSALSKCAIDEHGNTFMHIASCRKLLELSKTLLDEYKVDVNAKNGWGLTPLSLLGICIDQEEILLQDFVKSVFDGEKQLEMPKVSVTVQENVTHAGSYTPPPYDTLHDEL